MKDLQSGKNSFDQKKIHDKEEIKEIKIITNKDESIDKNLNSINNINQVNFIDESSDDFYKNSELTRSFNKKYYDVLRLELKNISGNRRNTNRDNIEGINANSYLEFLNGNKKFLIDNKEKIKLTSYLYFILFFKWFEWLCLLYLLYASINLLSYMFNNEFLIDSTNNLHFITSLMTSSIIVIVLTWFLGIIRQIIVDVSGYNIYYTAWNRVLINKIRWFRITNRWKIGFNVIIGIIYAFCLLIIVFILTFGQINNGSSIDLETGYFGLTYDLIHSNVLAKIVADSKATIDSYNIPLNITSTIHMVCEIILAIGIISIISVMFLSTTLVSNNISKLRNDDFIKIAPKIYYY